MIESINQESQENEPLKGLNNNRQMQYLNNEIELQKKQQQNISTNITKGSEYNDDNIPPNWQFAEDHLKARQNGPEILTDPINICDCCGYNVNRKQLPITCNITELSFLGSGFPLLFVFIKYSAIICMILFLISGVYSIVSNAISENCLTVGEIKEWLRKKSDYTQYSENELESFAEMRATEASMCFHDFFSIISLANKKNEGKIMLVQGILNLITVIAIIVLLQWFRKIQRKMDIECDEANISQSDFTVWVSNIAINIPSFDYDDGLKQFFENELKAKLNKNFEVKSISLGFNLQELEKFQKIKQKLLAQKAKAISKFNSNQIWPEGQSLETIDSLILKADQDIQKLEAQMVDGTSNKFCGTAFLSFNTEEQKNLIIHQFGVNAKLKLIFSGQPLEIRQSPEPNAILWYNLRYTKHEQLIRKIVSLIITVILMVGSFFAIYFLNNWQINTARTAQQNNESKLKEQIIGIIISLIIVVINNTLGIAIEILSNFEKYHMKTWYNISYAKKTSFIQFFNIAFIMFLVSLNLSQNIIGRGGLIFNVSILFITNSIVPPIMQVLRIPYYIKQILRWRGRKQDNKSALTQKQAQILYECPVFGIELIYCEILKTIFFSAFYFTLIPFGMLLTSIELAVLYWIYKYNLLRRSIVKFAQSAQLSLEMTEQLEYVVIIFAGSCLMFFLILDTIENSVVPPEYFSEKDKYFKKILGILCAGLVIAVVNAIFPWQWLNQKFFPEKEDEPLEITYEEAKDDFDTNFNIENPATRRIAVKQLVQTQENATHEQKKMKKEKKKKNKKKKNKKKDQK